MACNSKPIRDPANALSLKLASMVANGTMSPDKADMIRDDDDENTDTEENYLK